MEVKVTPTTEHHPPAYSSRAARCVCVYVMTRARKHDSFGANSRIRRRAPSLSVSLARGCHLFVDVK